MSVVPFYVFSHWFTKIMSLLCFILTFMDYARVNAVRNESCQHKMKFLYFCFRNVCCCLVDVYWTSGSLWTHWRRKPQLRPPSPITFPLTGVNKGPKEMSLQHF